MNTEHDKTNLVGACHICQGIAKVFDKGIYYSVMRLSVCPLENGCWGHFLTQCLVVY